MSAGGTYCFAVRCGKSKHAETLCIPKLGDARAMAASLADAVATLFGIEDSDIIKLTLDSPDGPELTPVPKHLQTDYNTETNTVLKGMRFNRLIELAVARNEAWARAKMYQDACSIIDVVVEFHSFWFAVYFTGSNKLVTPNLYVRKGDRLWSNFMTDSLTKQVASLTGIDSNAMRITLDSPAGPDLGSPIYRFSQERITNLWDFVEKPTVDLEQAWDRVREKQLSLTGTPRAIALFVSARTSTELAVDKLCRCSIHHGFLLREYSRLDVALRSNPRVALTGLKVDNTCGLHLAYALPRHFWLSKQFVLAALSTCSNVQLVFELSDSSLKNDKDVVFAAVSLNGALLRYASPTMQASKPIVMAAVANNAGALNHASDALKTDVDVVAKLKK